MQMILFGVMALTLLLSMLLVLAVHSSKVPVIQKMNKHWQKVVASFGLAGLFFAGVLVGGIDYLIFLIYLAMFCISVDVFGLVAGRVSKKEKKIWINSAKFKLLLPLMAAGLVMVAGYFVAHHRVLQRYEITLAKPLEQNASLQIAVITDVHLGTAVQLEDLSETVRRIKELEPDLIYLGGDFYDDNTTNEELLNSFDCLRELSAPQGVYFVFGNHDIGYQGNRRERYTKIIEEMAKAGIEVLEDEARLIWPNVCLIGRADPGTARINGAERKSIAELVQKVPPEVPIILLDHQPVELAAAEKAGIALELSGHTHNGHIFPGNILTSWLGFNEFNYGHYQKNDYQLLVSSGLGTWGMTVRTAGKSEIVWVEVK